MSDPHQNILSEITRTKLHEGVNSLLQDILAYNPSHQVVGTPQRVVRMYGELLSGYSLTLEEVVNNALFNVAYDEMVVVSDIGFYSLCEHHLIPFYGKAHVGYLPRHKIVGLSKIPRVVQMFAKRLQIQERLTMQIAEAIESATNARGVGIIIQARHLCAAMRGVRSENVEMTTSTMRGEFLTNEKTRAEFMNHTDRKSAL